MTTISHNLTGKIDKKTVALLSEKGNRSFQNVSTLANASETSCSVMPDPWQVLHREATLASCLDRSTACRLTVASTSSLFGRLHPGFINSIACCRAWAKSSSSWSFCRISLSFLPKRRTDNPMKRYANAEKVLPRDLFEKVQKHHTGILWVPARSRFYKERRQLVIALRLQGIESREIAVLAGVTPRRVNQVLGIGVKRSFLFTGLAQVIDEVFGGLFKAVFGHGFSSCDLMGGQFKKPSIWDSNSSTCPRSPTWPQLIIGSVCLASLFWILESKAAMRFCFSLVGFTSHRFFLP
jgi:hypothetical protein